MTFTDCSFELHLQDGSVLEKSAPILNGCAELKWDASSWFLVELGSMPYKDSPALSAAIVQLTGELQQHPFTMNHNLALNSPVRVRMRLHPDSVPEDVTSLYLFGDYWTRPAFANDLGGVPERTQVLLLRRGSRCTCIVGMVGEEFKTTLVPGDAEHLAFELYAGIPGQSRLSEPALIITESESVYDAVERAFDVLTMRADIRRRTERRYPEMLEYLGWCSWDACYRDVNASAVADKAAELTRKDVPVRWFLIDDGWLSTEEDYLTSFEPDSSKFPGGFGPLTDEIRRTSDVRWFGVWHTLAGYWGGIDPQSPVAREEVRNTTVTPAGRMLPAPASERAFSFFRTWYEELRAQGIDFVKVDDQGAVAAQYANAASLCRASRALHEGLEGAALFFDEAVINCMGMPMEHILTRPASPLSRNSDDFFPEKEDGFREHALQNAYNGLYHSQVYHCDWDMFWTSHPDAQRHALLRAISGSPVYVSDKVGKTNPDILRPLAYSDGRLLRMERCALPTQDVVFSNPLQSGSLVLTNVAHCSGSVAGAVAVFNLSDREQPYCFSPADILDIDTAERYIVCDYFTGSCTVRGCDDSISGRLSRDGYAWYQVVPWTDSVMCLGLTGKYAGFSAVQNRSVIGSRCTVTLREGGRVRFVSERTPRTVLAEGQTGPCTIVRERSNREISQYVVDAPVTHRPVSLILEF